MTPKQPKTPNRVPAVSPSLADSYLQRLELEKQFGKPKPEPEKEQQPNQTK